MIKTSTLAALRREWNALIAALPITLFIGALRERPDTTMTPADAALRARVLARLQHHPGWLREVSNVVVFDGAVILQGLFRRAAERRAVRTLALLQPGVREVRDDRVRAREWQSLG